MTTYDVLNIATYLIHVNCYTTRTYGHIFALNDLTDFILARDKNIIQLIQRQLSNILTSTALTIKSKAGYVPYFLQLV